MGRDALTESGNGNSGISGLVSGEKVHIEVRSALYQNFAYIVQQADVEIPHTGYARRGHHADAAINRGTKWAA